MPPRRNPRKKQTEEYDSDDDFIDNAPEESEEKEEEESGEEEELDEDAPPTSINPYNVLDLPTTATQPEIKTAYRKLALKTHPDKVAESEKESAHIKFQELAFAFAILSDERRRKRYDLTGRTEDSIHAGLDDDDFNWTDFFRAQFAEAVTEEKVNNFQKTYQGSEEERGDLLSAYTRFAGDMNKVYGAVMLSDAEQDEERFRKIITEAIDEGEVEGYKKFVDEKEKSWRRRMENAKKRKKAFDENQQQEDGEGDQDGTDLEEETEVTKSSKARGKRGGGGGEDGRKKKKRKENGMGDLAAIIQQRQQARSASFFDNVEHKYGGGGRNGRKRPSEPPEEAFENNRKTWRNQ